MRTGWPSLRLALAKIQQRTPDTVAMILPIEQRLVTRWLVWESQNTCAESTHSCIISRIQMYLWRFARAFASGILLNRTINRFSLVQRSSCDIQRGQSAQSAMLLNPFSFSTYHQYLKNVTSKRQPKQSLKRSNKYLILDHFLLSSNSLSLSFILQHNPLAYSPSLSGSF